MRILIRCDASTSLGSGHVMRCLTLADVLAAAGCQVHFACRSGPGDLQALIAARGHEVHALLVPDPRRDMEAALPWQDDIEALWSVLPAQLDFAWCVVDHYGLGHEWETAVRLRARRVLAIDDLDTRRHAVDLLLDQNLTAQRRTITLPDTARLLAGPRFALLRPAFARPRAECWGPIRRVLVSFGGVDAAGETLKVLTALADFAEFQVDVVAGPANPHWVELVERCQGHPAWRLWQHVEDFAGLLREADLAIGAGGGTAWERACLGVPSLCVSLAPNQRANAEALAAGGAHLYLGEAAQVSVAVYRAAVQTLQASPGLRQSLAARGRALVDGRGANRVATALLGMELLLRPATLEDARLLFEGRNAERVRQASVNTAPIGWEQHLAWLQQVLAQPERRLLLIGETLDGPVGVLRYDRLEGLRAEVSIYLLPERLGQGWGEHLLSGGEQAVRRHWIDLESIAAQVRPGNLASLQLFQRAGFLLRDHQLQLSLPRIPS
ncbi:UDP-2,4-diacetamido-2,4,6-trideoxy-beta-L-altropyranose hydrolase [Pseudomonas oryzihabitans]|uniref:UDP-2,4-diacetamido-2,4, 6-trideoxy-beta-L-altropyranose hydrolase n=1 Tax=Pseudomonas oryzihabitans TaxID=47885 RepID=UPI0009DD4C8B|nr:UDP-2,4-diacetamido-2,4,6-trideoxy-beta-L-altropyranose hydrolase [Pseudomonas oryzihabitans]NMZ44365.1 UDP-2,4-diacetamido-2,4,6-trideoxy-beta-L-altropyranose hydrolase [Pseudomonas oryzihabitans]